MKNTETSNVHGGSLAECVREREERSKENSRFVEQLPQDKNIFARHVLLAEYADSTAYIIHVRQLRCYLTDKSLLEQKKKN